MELKSYTIKYRLGFLGDMATEWWTAEDWRRHEEYVNKLKEEGRYGEESEVTITLMPNVLFDGQILDKVLGSCKMIFLDLSDIDVRKHC